MVSMYELPGSGVSTNRRVAPALIALLAIQPGDSEAQTSGQFQIVGASAGAGWMKLRPPVSGYRGAISTGALRGESPFFGASSILPKIILPLAVCSTLVTEISTERPIILRA